MKLKQLNPFELKSILVKLLDRINSTKDIANYLAEIELLDAQEDKSLLAKFLFKELTGEVEKGKIPVICFLLQHFVSKDELIKGLWESLQNKSIQADTKITIINLLRELDADWSYQACEDFVEDSQEILDESTKQLLNSAIVNPEVQIDFMDFLTSLKMEDKLTLINSLAQDFGDDELANILTPIIETNPESPISLEALKLIAQTKSQLALHSLEYLEKHTKDQTHQAIKKSLAVLKMSGVRQDNSKEFYKKILSESKPDKFYITYPDAFGDMAMIFTRITNDNRVRFVSFVINIEAGIKDCFGFYDISTFQADKIIEKFLKEEPAAAISPDAFVTLLFEFANTTYQNQKELPYEFVCWKNLLIDIDYNDLEVEQIVQDSVRSCDINETDISAISDEKFMIHWFLDKDYSDEFEIFLENLKNYSNLDKAIEENLNNVFTENEKQFQRRKLIISAYIKICTGQTAQAEKLYAIACCTDFLDKFLEHILKRSVYEYFTLIKIDKSKNNYDFTDEQIRFNIEYIEQNWVK